MPSKRIEEIQTDLHIKNCVKKLAVRKYANYYPAKSVVSKIQNSQAPRPTLKLNNKNTGKVKKKLLISKGFKKPVQKFKEKKKPVNNSKNDGTFKQLQLFNELGTLDEHKKFLLESNKFKIYARRILPNGECQYLIEWA